MKKVKALLVAVLLLVPLLVSAKPVDEVTGSDWLAYDQQTKLDMANGFILGTYASSLEASGDSLANIKAMDSNNGDTAQQLVADVDYILRTNPKFLRLQLGMLMAFHRTIIDLLEKQRKGKSHDAS